MLALLLAQCSWLYRGLRRRADQGGGSGLPGQEPERGLPGQQPEAAAERPPGGTGAAAGRLLGAQLSWRVEGGGALWSWGLDAGHRLGRLGGDTGVPQLTLPQLTVGRQQPRCARRMGRAGAQFVRAAAARARCARVQPPAVRPPPPQVVSAAASRHSLLLTHDGAVWSMGPGDSAGGGGHGSAPLVDAGQLGRGGSQAPARVGALAGAPRVVQVAAGRYHSVALAADGAVLTWGLNDAGQLGRAVAGRNASASGAGGGACTHGWSCADAAPARVEALAGLRIVGVAAGRYSALALDGEGRLWSWGYDACPGQLAPAGEAWRPRPVGGALRGRRVVAFDVGYTFWLAVTDDGAVWSCDNLDDGYAGTLPTPRRPNAAGELGRGGDPHQPGRVGGALAEQRVVAVAAGRAHALAVTADGRVFSWGGGQPALGREGPAGEPGLVAGELAGQHVRHVAAGEYFSLAATTDRVFSWGSNAYGCLGSGDAALTQRGAPAAVAGPLGSGGWAVRGLVAGYQHALAIADKPRDVELARLRADAAAAAAATSGGGGGGTAGVEVVLTERQQRERQQWLAEHHHEQRAADPASGADPARTADAAADAAPQPRAAANSSGDACAPPHERGWRWAYLPAGAPALPAPRDAWAARAPAPWAPALAALAPDVFAGLPAAFDARHVNPCWRDGPSLACLPFFMIVGVSKCGTSDLYARLTMHRRILPAANKPWSAFAGAAGANATMPALLREAAPWLRLILLLRDPVERYESAFYYYRWWEADKPAPTADDLHARATEDVAAWRRCAAAEGVAACVRGYRPQQLVKGMYAEFLQDWLRHWPRSQLLVLRFEDYVAALPEHLDAALRFLGVPRPPQAAWDAMTGAPPANAAARRPPMRADTRRLLADLYAPFNAALAAALGDCRWRWEDAGAA
ncbi:Herc2 [Scenedesmus sp. PABB004]|nr:Herc2 [Scenedesmus sp. PABB004]